MYSDHHHYFELFVDSVKLFFLLHIVKTWALQMDANRCMLNPQRFHRQRTMQTLWWSQYVDFIFFRNKYEIFQVFRLEKPSVKSFASCYYTLVSLDLQIRISLFNIREKFTVNSILSLHNLQVHENNSLCTKKKQLWSFPGDHFPSLLLVRIL